MSGYGYYTPGGPGGAAAGMGYRYPPATIPRASKNEFMMVESGTYGISDRKYNKTYLEELIASTETYFKDVDKTSANELFNNALRKKDIGVYLSSIRGGTARNDFYNILPPELRPTRENEWKEELKNRYIAKLYLDHLKKIENHKKANAAERNYFKEMFIKEHGHEPGIFEL